MTEDLTAGNGISLVDYFDKLSAANDKRCMDIEAAIVKHSGFDVETALKVTAIAANLQTFKELVSRAYETRFDAAEARLLNHTQFNIEVSSKVSSIVAELHAFKDQMTAVDIAQKEAISAALIAQKEAVVAAMTSAKEAVLKAEIASEKRFDGVNEFRAALADQQRSLMPRQECEVQIKGLSDKIDRLNASELENRSGKHGIKEGWGAAAGVVGLLFTFLLLANLIATFFHKP